MIWKWNGRNDAATDIILEHGNECSYLWPAFNLTKTHWIYSYHSIRQNGLLLTAANLFSKNNVGDCSRDLESRTTVVNGFWLQSRKKFESAAFASLLATCPAAGPGGASTHGRLRSAQRRPLNEPLRPRHSLGGMLLAHL